MQKISRRYDKNHLIQKDGMDMEQVLVRFLESFTGIYVGADEKLIRSG